MVILAASRPIAISESLLRHKAVENALADLRLEGLATGAGLMVAKDATAHSTVAQVEQATEIKAIEGATPIDQGKK